MRNQKKNMKISYTFSYGDLNKFVLFFRKEVYPYVYMDSQNKFIKTSSPSQKDFYRY